MAEIKNTFSWLEEHKYTSEEIAKLIVQIQGLSKDSTQEPRIQHRVHETNQTDLYNFQEAIHSINSQISVTEQENLEFKKAGMRLFFMQAGLLDFEVQTNPYESAIIFFRNQSMIFDKEGTTENFSQGILEKLAFEDIPQAIGLKESSMAFWRRSRSPNPEKLMKTTTVFVTNWNDSVQSLMLDTKENKTKYNNILGNPSEIKAVKYNVVYPDNTVPSYQIKVENYNLMGHTRPSMIFSLNRNLYSWNNEICELLLRNHFKASNEGMYKLPAFKEKMSQAMRRIINAPKSR